MVSYECGKWHGVSTYLFLPWALYLIRSSQYLEFFDLKGKDSGGGVGTASALIFGIVSEMMFVICIPVD